MLKTNIPPEPGVYDL